MDQTTGALQIQTQSKIFFWHERKSRWRSMPSQWFCDRIAVCASAACRCESGAEMPSSWAWCQIVASNSSSPPKSSSDVGGSWVRNMLWIEVAVWVPAHMCSCGSCGSGCYSKVATTRKLVSWQMAEIAYTVLPSHLKLQHVENRFHTSDQVIQVCSLNLACCWHAADTYAKLLFKFEPTNQETSEVNYPLDLKSWSLVLPACQIEPMLFVFVSF